MGETRFVLMAAALASAPACANAGLILGHFTETGVTSLGTDIHTMKDADALLAGAIPGTTPSTAMIPLVNLKDPDNPGGHFHFHHKSPFITDRPGDDRDFAIQITGAIHIPAAGQYTFGVNSDDGFRLQVGSNLSEHVEQRPPKDTLAVFTFDHAADYPLSLTYFEHKGHAELELFASPGRVMSFNDPGADFELIGDAPHGGLELVPDVGAPVRLVGSGVPEAAPAWAAIALAPLLSRRLRRPL